MDFSVGTGRNGGLPETATRYFLTTPKHGKAGFFMAHTSASGNQAVTGIRLSTNGIAPQERQSWLREVICREYAHVDITSPGNQGMSQDLAIYSGQNLQLSVIRSSAISIQRLPQEPWRDSQDAYFAVVLVSGRYKLSQNGREAYLQPGDMAIYDATLAHRVQCPDDFSKLIVAIPRGVFRERVAGADHCTALRIPGHTGSGLIASHFLRTFAGQIGHVNPQEFAALSGHAVDLLALAAASVRPLNVTLSKSRVFAMNRIKAFIEQHLPNARLDTAMVSQFSGLSPRSINSLFASEGTSLMRYVWQRRLAQCHKDMSDPLCDGRQISEIAFRWGFNDPSHFSRVFKRQFGSSPRDYRCRILSSRA